MSSEIDERVVQMKFDNSQFESKIAQTQSTLEKFKNALHLGDAAKNFDELDAASKRFSLAGLAEGVENISSKFTALGVVGVTTMATLASKAVDSGLQIAKALTIDPIADGYADYGRKLTSMQTIMNATGKGMDVVGGYFSQLDTYADKTIYNLDDMTGAFAKFTNAGVSMDKSVPAIKGIANMTALAGQDAGAASIAMYNLSQSIAGGFLTTTDYKSLNLANIATKEWKDQMIAGAVAAGTLKKTADGKFEIKGMKGVSTDAELFNDNLKEGWATTEVMMKVLGDYGDVNTAIGKKAQSAAQDVKSWGMMMETLSAGVGTGWTDTFEILVGNVEEAKKLFSPLTETIGGFLDEMSAARNDPLKEWKDLGGRTAAIEAIKNAFHALMGILTPIKQAFVDIFPPVTGKNLFEITKAIQNFTATLKPSDETMNNIKRTFKGVFAVLDIGRMIIMGVVGLFGKLFGSAAGASGGILNITAVIGDFLVSLRDAIKNGNGLTKFFEILGNVLKVPIDAIRSFIGWIGSLFGAVGKVDTSKVTGGIEQIKAKMEPLKAIGDKLSEIWRGLGDIFRHVMNFFAPMAKAIGDFMGDFGKHIGESLSNLKFNDILNLVNTGLLGGLVLMFKKFLGGGLIDQIKGIFVKDDGGDKGPSLMDRIKESIGGLTDTLKTMQTTLKATTLIIIAAAIALLTASVVALSKIDSNALAKALGAMAVMFTQLMIGMGILSKIAMGASAVKMGIIAGAMVLMAIAIRILASAVGKLSGLSWEELAKGLGSVMFLLLAIAGTTKLMQGGAKRMITTGIGIIAIAIAIRILAGAVKVFSGMSWKELAKGLGSVGILLGSLALFTRLVKVNKGAMTSAVGLILLGAALKIIASVVKDLGLLSVKELGKGLGSISAILGALAVFSRVVNPAQMISMGVSMVIIGAALKIIASAVKDMGSMSVKELIKGLGAVAIILGSIALFSNIVNPVQMLGVSVAMVIMGGALKILASVLKDLGGMSWDEIIRSLVVLGGSLLILAGAMAIMGMPPVLLGAVGIVAVSAAMMMLAPALKTLGTMSWDEIGRGLAMLASSLAILAIGGILIIPAAVGFAILGAAVMMLGTGMLLAGIGMTAFAAALVVLAGAGAVGTAVLIGLVQGLLGLIPFAMSQLGLGIIEFAKVIATGGPAIVMALNTVLLSLLEAIRLAIPAIFQTAVLLIMTLLQAIQTTAPAIISTLWGLIVLLVNTVVNGVPFFVDAGMRMLKGILDGIANNIGGIVDSATNIIVNFINGISNNLPKVTNAGADLVIKFVNSIADTIRTRSGEMGTAGGNLASAMIEGMVNGIGNGINRITESARNMASKAFEAAKDFLNINSPSKKFRDLGHSTGEGYMVGIDNYQGRVEKSSAALGEVAFKSLRSSMGKMKLGGGPNLNPTIKPVLDLSNIKRDSNQIGSMLKTPTLSVKGAYATASTLSSQQRANEEAAANSKTAVAEARYGDNITFIQNNNSPKALPAADIYRRTNSQIATLKRKKEEVS